jgi:hypothetical protein
VPRSIPIALELDMMMRLSQLSPTSTFATRDFVAKVDVGSRVVRSGNMPSESWALSFFFLFEDKSFSPERT